LSEPMPKMTPALPIAPGTPQLAQVFSTRGNTSFGTSPLDLRAFFIS
jgi:hypothetical protein